MFSFVEDTVLEPFGGTFSTALAAINAHRNSIINEVDPAYFDFGKKRVSNELQKLETLFASPEVEIVIDEVNESALRRTA
jgi:DNA modification methylase